MGLQPLTKKPHLRWVHRCKKNLHSAGVNQTSSRGPDNGQMAIRRQLVCARGETLNTAFPWSVKTSTIAAVPHSGCEMLR